MLWDKATGWSEAMIYGPGQIDASVVHPIPSVDLCDILGSKLFWRLLFGGWLAHTIGWAVVYSAFTEYMTTLHGPYRVWGWTGPTIAVNRNSERGR